MKYAMFVKKCTKDLSLKLAKEIAEEARRLSNRRFPPASAPYEAPARRSGQFRDGIKAEPSGNRAKVTFLAPYSGFLLFGTVNMEPRPVHEMAVQNVLKRRK